MEDKVINEEIEYEDLLARINHLAEKGEHLIVSFPSSNQDAGYTKSRNRNTRTSKAEAAWTYSSLHLRII